MAGLFRDDFDGPAVSDISGRVTTGGTWGPPPWMPGAATMFSLDGAGNAIVSTLFAQESWATTAALTGTDDYAEIALDVTPSIGGVFDPQTVIRFGQGYVTGLYLNVYFDGVTSIRLPDTPTAPTVVVNTAEPVIVRHEVRRIEDDTDEARTLVNGVVVSDWAPYSGIPARVIGDPVVMYMAANNAGPEWMPRVLWVEVGTGGAEPERPPAFWTNFRRTHEIR